MSASLPSIRVSLGLIVAAFVVWPAMTQQPVTLPPSSQVTGPGATPAAPRPGDPAAMPPAASPEELYREALQQLIPLTPEQIRKFREQVQQNREAILSRDLKPSLMSTRIDFKPGALPPEIVVSPGIATAVTFLDGAGNPWPIVRHVIGDAAGYQIIRMNDGDDEPGHALTITPLMPAGASNLVIALKGAPLALVILVRIHPDSAHFRHDFLLSTLGPESSSDIVIPAAPDQAGGRMLLTFLSGADLPDDARKVPVSGVDADAWIYRKNMYVRSAHHLLSPAYSGTMTGPNRLRIWLIEEPTSQLLFSVAGQIHRARVNL